MPSPSSTLPPAPPLPVGRLRRQDCRLEDLQAVLAAGTDPADHPHAAGIEQGVPVYDAATLRAADADPVAGAGLEAELADVLLHGAGIVVVAGAFAGDVVRRATDAFDALVAEQRAAGLATGDHFAAAGANDRVWNALEKLAVADPGVFVDYYANEALALVSRAWLGPGYQVTSQLNVVNPGGRAQTVHRDYHLGFMSPDRAEAYPGHVHALSPVLTLQGAVAHCDMPVESGPTLYLPHSQKYPLGYLAYWLPEFQEYFATHHVQLPLRTGDAVFFNPALLHAAGSNRTADVRRMANLLQVSSAFGRAMESVDRTRTVEAVYPALLERRAAGVDERLLGHVVAAAAEGYPFPKNLDRDAPDEEMGMRTQADLVRAALAAGTPADRLAGELAALDHARASH